MGREGLLTMKWQNTKLLVDCRSFTEPRLAPAAVRARDSHAAPRKGLIPKYMGEKKAEC